MSGIALIKRSHIRFQTGSDRTGLSEQGVGIDGDADFAKLPEKVVAPCATTVVLDVSQALQIGRKLDAGLVDHRDVIAPECADEETELEDHVLSCSRFKLLRLSLLRAEVVRREQHHGVTGTRSSYLQLLDESASSVRLVVQDQGFDLRGPAEERIDAELQSVVVAVDDEDRIDRLVLLWSRLFRCDRDALGDRVERNALLDRPQPLQLRLHLLAMIVHFLPKRRDPKTQSRRTIARTRPRPRTW